ncbi:MAG TPA: alpha-N-arabinofuranosidase [Candidatus Hydrogenedentes bacterium]|nr:alpha-N-arabinofuranosidase [Candidatus Hydrogenedentota bacterium]
MSGNTSLRIFADEPKHQISRYLYAHFAEHLGRCIYGGIWVGGESGIEHERGIRLDTVSALKNLALPALRWPGGCFADNYHWMDGIGPRHKRPRRHNLWWKQPETNQFGTDEFMRFCAMVGAEPYLCANVGSGSPEETRAWVEYCNADQPSTLVQMRKENGHPEPYGVRFWGIGNENWGCGGSMRPEYYADLFRQHATYVRSSAGEGAKIIACGSHPGIPEWDTRFLEALEGARHLVDYIALHIYAVLGQGVSDVHFTEDDYYTAVVDAVDVMDTHIGRAIGAAQAYSPPGHRIGVVMDEWGTWFKEATVESGLLQQNTMLDALFTATSFHCFHEHGEHLFMTNMAQTVNVLQALVLTKGAKLVVTPTYHVWEMLMPHRDGRLVPCRTHDVPPIKSRRGKERQALSVSVTTSPDGAGLFASLVNLDHLDSLTVDMRIDSDKAWRIDRLRRLATGDLQSHNTFDAPNTVAPEEVPIEGAGDLRTLTLPPQSITTIQMTPA